MHTKSWLNAKEVLILCFINTFLVHAAFAAQEIDINAEGLVFNGYDLVAYHVSEKAVEGKAAFQIEYMGGKLRFVSEENKKIFLAKQGDYLPAYGGFCAYGVRVGKKFNGVPNSWTIKNNKLYFFLNDATKIIWSKEQDKNLEISDRLWSKVKYKPISVAE